MNEIKSSVAFVKDRPCYELAGTEVIYPIKFGDKQALFHMKPATSAEIKAIYSENSSLRRRQRGQVERVFQMPEQKKTREFFDLHFIYFEGAKLETGEDPTIEQQKEWLEENEGIKSRVYREGYDLFTAPERIDLPTDSTALVIGLSKPENRIEAETILYSAETKSSQTIRLAVTMDRLTKQEHHQYDRAFSIIENSRTNEQYFSTNWDTIEALFDRKARKLEGALSGGEACQEATREGWLPLVPFPFKVFALSQLAAGIDLKNV